MRKLLLLTLLVSSVFCGYAQNVTERVWQRARKLVSQMTLEEKILYLGAYEHYCIRPISRLGIPKIVMSDGPVGVRNAGQSTSFPAGVMAAATWNRALLEREGKALAQDCKARGVHILLTPGVNIMRAPLCGRNFEYYSEDPYLASQMAVPLIKGLQGNGVLACVKHFAGNNQEWDRGNVSSNIDLRTLHELYLPAFKASVTDAGVGAIMDGYNLVNGTYMTANRYLNVDVLRNQWHFSGIVMSDWGAAHDALADMKGGLDLEMLLGNAEQYTIGNLTELLRTGKITEDMIDEKVEHILTTVISAGFLDNNQQDSSIQLDNPFSAQTALAIAREGIVLLKNKGVLPLSEHKVKRVVLIGPHANTLVWGGGSSTTPPYHYSTLYTALDSMVGSNTQIALVDNLDEEALSMDDNFYVERGSGKRGLKCNFFTNTELEGTPVYSSVHPCVVFDWKAESPDKLVPADHFSACWTGVVRMPRAGVCTFKVKGDDGYRLWVDDSLIIDSWRNQAVTENSAMYEFVSGGDYDIRLEYYDYSGNASISMMCTDNTPVIQEAAREAAKADVAVVCVGFDKDTEAEGADRTFMLPGYQEALLKVVSNSNPNTIVIVNGGGAVDMRGWIDRVKAIVYAWYPGQEGGRALSEVLYGRINPSGKLPVTFDKCWEDNPCYDFYHAKDGKKEISYDEKLLVGYRYYDTRKLSPQFPFGFGMSYTSFRYSDMKVMQKADNCFEVMFDVQNTGSVEGAEIVQLYVKPIDSKEFLPEKSLKGFDKVFLKKGEKKRVSMIVPAEAFEVFNIKEGRFTLNPGTYELLVGASSRDIRMGKRVHIE